MRGAIPWLDATKMHIADFGQEANADSSAMRTRPDGTRVKIG